MISGIDSLIVKEIEVVVVIEGMSG